jgi:hypothetical protein
MDDYYANIPAITKDTMDRYANNGYPMGHFLTAVFSNDLVGAVNHADEQNLGNLKLIVQYMYNQLPSGCWGSKEAVKAWIEMDRDNS